MKKQFIGSVAVIAFLASSFTPPSLWCTGFALWKGFPDVLVIIMLLLSIYFGIRTIKFFRIQDASLFSGWWRIGIISGFVILVLNAAIFVSIALLLQPVAYEEPQPRCFSRGCLH